MEMRWLDCAVATADDDDDDALFYRIKCYIINKSFKGNSMKFMLQPFILGSFMYTLKCRCAGYLNHFLVVSIFFSLAIHSKSLTKFESKEAGGVG